MPFMWTADLDTGIPEIDAQNRRLADFINTLDDAREQGDRERVGAVLDELLDFTVNHFLFEEQLMQKAEYEFLSAHERIHEVFAKRLADFRGRYANGEDITEPLQTMLQNWVAVHVKEEDKRYAASVQQVIADEGGRTWVSGLVRKLFG